MSLITTTLDLIRLRSTREFALPLLILAMRTHTERLRNGTSDNRRWMMNRARELNALFGLEGRNAIVTGGGSGLGRAIARLYSLAGARVVVAGRRRSALEAVVREVNATAETEVAFAIPADVSEEADVARLFESSAAILGRIDIVVNAAAFIRKYALAQATAEVFDKTQATNLRGVFLCVREAVKHMRSQGRGGSIINISSVAALRADVLDNAVYAASKGGVNAITTNLALEVAPDNIRINAILPGAFPVERTQQEAREVSTYRGPFMNPERVPLGRFGHPDELASVALFLASPAASYITGQLICVDGGFMVS